MFSEDRIQLMKKSLKIYGWAWVAVIAATLIAIAYSESSNNLDRTASRWDVFEHRGKFVSELPEEAIIALDELCLTDSLHWHKAKDRSVYSYYDEGGSDGLYNVFCLISSDGFTTVYEIDEDEGIFIFLPIALGCTILFKWGLVLIIISIIRRVKNKKSHVYEKDNVDIQ